MQTDDDVAAELKEYVPAAQLMQVVAPIIVE